MSQTYILLPHGVRTGGPEALLQLSDALHGSGDSETFVVFFDKGQVALLREFMQAFADRHQGGLQPDMFAAPAARKPRQSTRSGPGPTAGEATDD